MNEESSPTLHQASIGAFKHDDLFQYYCTDFQWPGSTIVGMTRDRGGWATLGHLKFPEQATLIFDQLILRWRPWALEDLPAAGVSQLGCLSGSFVQSDGLGPGARKKRKVGRTASQRSWQGIFYGCP